MAIRAPCFQIERLTRASCAKTRTNFYMLLTQQGRNETRCREYGGVKRYRREGFKRRCANASSADDRYLSVSPPWIDPAISDLHSVDEVASACLRKREDAAETKGMRSSPPVTNLMVLSAFATSWSMADHLCSGMRQRCGQVTWLDRHIHHPIKAWRFPWDAFSVVRTADTHDPNCCSKRDCRNQCLLRHRHRSGWYFLESQAGTCWLKRRSLVLAASTYVCGVNGYLISLMGCLRENVCCVSISCLVGWATCHRARAVRKRATNTPPIMVGRSAVPL